MVYCHQQNYNTIPTTKAINVRMKVPIFRDTEHEYLFCGLRLQYSTVKRLSLLASIIDAKTLV